VTINIQRYIFLANSLSKKPLFSLVGEKKPELDIDWFAPVKRRFVTAGWHTVRHANPPVGAGASQDFEFFWRSIFELCPSQVSLSPGSPQT
jgi:hypothetical protein